MDPTTTDASEKDHRPFLKPAPTPQSPRGKLISFISVCVFLTITFVNFNLPVAFLPFYSEERNISSGWTGLILGSTHLGLILGPVFLAGLLLTKFSTPVLMCACACCTGTFTLLFALLDFVPNLAVFKPLALLDRFLVGVFGGCLNVTVFATLVKIYPDNVGVVTAIGEAVLNTAVASSPFIGAILYAWSGFIVAFIVPGAIMVVSALPVLRVPDFHSVTDGDKDASGKMSSLMDPWLLFPLWHLASSQILMSYHMPLLPVYAEHTFDAGVVWSGAVLLTATAVVCVASPILGVLIDKFGPCKMMLASCVSLPVVYVCVGPLPLLPLSPSRTQLILSLAFLGVSVPMACISALPITFDIYRARNNGNLPTWVTNSLIALYCAAYPVGLTIGSTVSGFIAPYASFAWSTGTLGLMYTVESAFCAVFCFMANKMMTESSKAARYSEVAEFQPLEKC